MIDVLVARFLADFVNSTPPPPLGPSRRFSVALHRVILRRDGDCANWMPAVASAHPTYGKWSNPWCARQAFVLVPDNVARPDFYMNLTSFFVGLFRGVFYVSLAVLACLFVVSFALAIYVLHEVSHDPGNAAEAVAHITKTIRQIFHMTR
jgi:hypothetical protein